MRKIAEDLRVHFEKFLDVYCLSVEAERDDLAVLASAHAEAYLEAYEDVVNSLPQSYLPTQD